MLNFFKKLSLFYRIYILEAFLYRTQWKNFYKVFGGHIFFQVLYAATRFDLFTLLDKRGSMNLEAIAKELGIERQPCRIMLLGLVASGILRKRGELYQNTKLTSELLNRESSGNVLAYVELQNMLYYKCIPYFYDSVAANTNKGVEALPADGATLYQRMEQLPELQLVFQNAMQDLSRRSNKSLVQFLDLQGVKYLIDVGGGNGTNIISLARKNKDLKAAVFDFPGVAKLAKENIERNDLAGRLSAIPGNCFEDPFPSGADCFIFCHFFTMWSKEEDLKLLKKSYEALPKGGKTIIFNMMQENDGRGPLSAALGSPYFLAIASGTGMLYTWEDYQEIFQKAGFREVTTTRLPMDHGFICGVK